MWVPITMGDVDIVLGMGYGQGQIIWEYAPTSQTQGAAGAEAMASAASHGKWTGNK